VLPAPSLHHRGGFKRHRIFFFFEQPSSLFRWGVRSTCIAIPFNPPAPPLHRTVEEVVPMPLPLALPLFNPVPLYIYFYVLGCFWIRLDLIFYIVCVLLYFQS